MAGTWVINRLLWFIRSYAAYVNKDFFTIDNFKYNPETHDVYVFFHVQGKRGSQWCKTVDEIVQDNKLINSLSRVDALKIGQLHGRSQEKKRYQQLQEIDHQKD